MGIEVEIAGLKLKNPTMLAAGILGTSGALMKRVAGEGGLGAIVTKSIGLEAREGYPNPTIVEVQAGLLNAMGLPNPGAKEFVKEIRVAKESRIPIVASIYGYSAKEFAEVAKVLKDADAFELNLSCPHVKGTGAEISHEVAEIVKEVKRVTEKPVFVKLGLDAVELGPSIEKAGADGITAINTIRAMAIDIKTKRPILWNKIGGLSGPAIKPIAIRCVYELYEAVKIPIIGCGGISSWQDAVEFILAGATCVQIGSAVATKGLTIFKEISQGIESYLAREGYERIDELIGLAHEQ